MTLHVDSLSIGRSGRRILDGVSFSAEPGDAVVLRGPNGVGKTTLLRCLAGFMPAFAGTATYKDARLDGPDGLQEHVAYGGHADALKSALTIEENLAFWARLYGTDIRKAVDAFALTPVMERMAAQCSQGQKRRAGLARLILTDRPCWLLDEPTAALDTDARGLLADVLTAHRAAGGIVVMATHDPDIAANPTTLVLERAAQAANDPFLAPFLAEGNP